MTEKLFTPVTKERISTIKANMKRKGLSFEDVANLIDETPANIYATLRGRYTEATTSNNLTEIETALAEVLGVRYIQPYFNDLVMSGDEK